MSEPRKRTSKLFAIHPTGPSLVSLDYLDLNPYTISNMASSSTMDGLAAMMTLSTFLRFLGLWILYHVVRALYNISPMHPLSHIPGPKLAAMSLLYEFWYDMVLGGTYTQVISKMHETYGEKRSDPTVTSFSLADPMLTYTMLCNLNTTNSSSPSGPVVRISPDELHCNDAAFVDEIYAAAGRKRNKQVHNLNVLAGPTTKATFGTLDHDLHRVRRNAMNKFFSRAQITRLEPEMLKLTQSLCDKLLSMYLSLLIR